MYILKTGWHIPKFPEYFFIVNPHIHFFIWDTLYQANAHSNLAQLYSDISLLNVHQP